MCVELFYDLMDGSIPIPGSSVYGVLQARILEWVAVSFSRGSSQNKDQTRVSSIGTLPLNHQGSQSLWYFLLKWNRPGCRWCKAKFGCGDRPGEAGLLNMDSFFQFCSQSRLSTDPAWGQRQGNVPQRWRESLPLHCISYFVIQPYLLPS